MSALSDRPDDAQVGNSIPHESARLHVTGKAIYTDDLVYRTKDILHAYPVQVFHAHARVTALEVDAALAVPGVVRVLTATDVPGVNDAGIHADEPLFPTEVMFNGQAVCWVLGETLEAARIGAAAVRITLDDLPSMVTIREAMEANSYQGIDPRISRGDVDAGMSESSSRFQGELEIGSQEHFYLETQAALAYIDDSGQLFIESSTQHPSETQEVVARVLGKQSNEVCVEAQRMGGAFGGKEMQPHGFAAIAALGAVLTERPVRVRLNRSQDLTMTGKRHDFLAQWEVGFDDDGRIGALDVTLVANGGWSLDLSDAVLTRAMVQLDNCYWIPNIRLHGRIVKTNLHSNTAFRGFGTPQGMLVIEDILGRCAPLLGIDADVLRRRNFYRAGQTTPYGQVIPECRTLARVWDSVLESADFNKRRTAVHSFNDDHQHRKRGIAITAVKHGVSFVASAANQAGALVHVYRDGSVLITHGGTEMGQGVHTKVLQVAATALGIPLSRVRLAPTRTDKVPNTSATSASTGADLNGAAVKEACDKIRARLLTVAATQLGANPADMRVTHGRAHVIGQPDGIDWEDLVMTAYRQRVQLFASGFYRTDGVYWDPVAFHGSPFKYFAYGAAVSEVEVDEFAGSYRIRRVDIVHDVGNSLSPLVDLGQIEGAFVQGVGWLTIEDTRWDTGDSESRGRFLTQSASTYKLPSFSEMPDEFNVTMLKDSSEAGAIYGSKAVGEPPLGLAISVREALRDAIAAFGPPSGGVALPIPAIPEAVYWAIQRTRMGAQSADGSAGGVHRSVLQAGDAESRTASQGDVGAAALTNV